MTLSHQALSEAAPAAVADEVAAAPIGMSEDQARHVRDFALARLIAPWLVDNGALGRPDVVPGSRLFSSESHDAAVEDVSGALFALMTRGLDSNGNPEPTVGPQELVNLEEFVKRAAWNVGLEVVRPEVSNGQ